MVRTYLSLVGAGVSVVALLVSVLSIPPANAASAAESLFARSPLTVSFTAHHAHTKVLSGTTRFTLPSTRVQ